MAAVAQIVAPAVAGLGFELVDVQASNRGRLLRVFIDKASGVNIDECAAVSRHLSRVLAVEGVAYERLEVSSPGLDRPLRKPADFQRFAGRRAEVRMRLPDANGRRRFVGVLRGLEREAVAIEVEGNIVSLELAGMERARLVPDL